MSHNNPYSRFDVLRQLLKKPSLRIATFGFVLTCFLPGCTTPVYYTDNPFLLYLPGAGRRSDQIPGYTNPRDRAKLIVEKGKKGQDAPAEEKDILLVQLVQEYEKTSSPHLRRASLEAIGRISSNYANPAAEKIFKSALEDDDMELNFSACRALGDYCAEGPIAEDGQNKEQRKLAISLLSARYRELPYSIAAGSEEDNNRRKDVRLAVLHALGKFKSSDSPELYDTLEYALTGEKLDDGALESAACSALGLITGKKYGLDGEAWLKYIAYERGEETTAPEEPSFMSRAPRIDNVTGIVK